MQSFFYRRVLIYVPNSVFDLICFYVGCIMTSVFNSNASDVAHTTAKKRILVVDDDPIVRKLVVTIANAAGFTVVEASNGEEALKFITESGEPLPELMLVDVYMPHMDGIKYCNTLKENEFFPLDRVVIVSAANAKRDQELIKSLPIRGFIQKPFTKRALQDLLSSI